MRSLAEHVDGQGSTGPELGVLAEVSRTPETTQRSLAHRLGISLGLTNHLIRKLVSKGYVRVVTANWRRRFYAVTPKGMVQKVRLTLGYVRNFLDDYQNVKLILHEELSSLALHKESRIAIYGPGDFGELVYLAVRGLGIEEVHVFGPSSQANANFVGMSVQDSADLKPSAYDRVLVTELSRTEEACLALRDLGVAHEALVTFFALPSLTQRPGAESIETRSEVE